MYHWILIVKNSLKKDSASKLIAENDFQLREQVNPNVKKQWFWMGLFETLPSVAGLLSSELVDSILFTYDYLIAGILISLLIIRIFKKQVPHPPIHLHTNNSTKFNFYTPPIH